MCLMIIFNVDDNVRLQGIYFTCDANIYISHIITCKICVFLENVKNGLSFSSLCDFFVGKVNYDVKELPPKDSYLKV